MTPQHHLPADIERTSMGIITAELAARGLQIPEESAAVVKRVIHTTADFDYAENLHFTPGAVAAGHGRRAQRSDDHHRHKYGAGRHHQARDWRGWQGRRAALWRTPLWPQRPKQAGTTRAVAAMHKAARDCPGAVLAVGNAPTALLTIVEEIENGLRRRWSSACRWAL